MFAIGLVVSLVLFVALGVIQSGWLSGGGLCFVPSACEMPVRELLESSGGAPGDSGGVLKNPLFWWAHLDNLFVIAYAITLILGFRFALQPVASVKRAGRYVLYALCGVAVLAGLTDFAENALLLSFTVNEQEPAVAVARIARFTACKFILFFTALGLLIVALLLRPILRRRQAKR